MLLPLPSGDSFVDLLKCFRLKKGESSPVSYRSQRWWWHFEIGQHQKIVNDILKMWGASNLWGTSSSHTYGWYRHPFDFPSHCPFPPNFPIYPTQNQKQQTFCNSSFGLLTPHALGQSPKKIKLFGWLPLKEYETRGIIFHCQTLANTINDQ